MISSYLSMTHRCTTDVATPLEKQQQTSNSSANKKTGTIMDQKVATILLAICALISCLGSAEAGLGFGRCPQKKAMQNFELDQYLGRWYEEAKFGAFFEYNGKCIQAIYSEEEDVVKVVNVMLDKDTNKKTFIEGHARPSDDSGDAKLDVTFPGPVGNGNATAPYWVLSTDYKNYALVYSCSNLVNIAHIDFGWILSRTPAMKPALRQKVNDLVVKNGMRVGQFEETVQSCGPLDP